MNCKARGCTKAAGADGYCGKHRQRIKRFGSPELPTKDERMRAAIPKFMRRVKKLPSGCWEYQGSRDTNGYGLFCVAGKYVNTHRFAWFAHHKQWPTMYVLHRCDNRICCNPAHLFLGTQSDNMQDCAAKGRLAIQKEQK